MNGVNLKIWLAITVFLSGMVGTSFGYKIIYVDDNAKGANNGSSWENAYNFLQDALADASSSAKPVEIRVAQGIYKPDQGTGITPGGRTAAFQLINGVTIKGGYAGPRMSLSGADPNAQDIALYETILSGDIGILSDKSDNCYHVFYHPQGLNLDDTAILDGFTITGGNANVSWPHDCGGGMYNFSSSPAINGCIFSRNSADGVGGGMCNDDYSSLILTNCTFSRNSSRGEGGGMYNRDNSSPSITNCTFNGNSASYGGGMYNRYYSNPTVENCTFGGNSASYGGGMSNDYSSPTVTNCTFSGNSAGWGCGMYNDHSSLTMTNCTFSANSAKYGGGICNYYSSPTVEGCTFSGNSAYYGGGGMFNDHSSPKVNNCPFTDNSANKYNGGGMCNNWFSSPTVNNCTFSGNSAYGGGGGMVNYNYSSPNINNCAFSSNSAGAGCGMYNSFSSPHVKDCTFSGNSATYGGGMSNYSSSPMVEGCTFSSNSASYAGGGMCNNWFSSPTVTNCNFSTNSAGWYGGGMFNDHSSPTVTNCTFSGNSAKYGGGMSNEESSSPNVNNCTFSGNSASDDGGAMFNYTYSSPTVTNCTIADNNAPNGRAMACDSDRQSYPSTVTMLNCIIWNGSDWLWNNDRSTITVTYSDVQGGWIGEGNINADPCFIDAKNGDFHLLPDSPCINAGDPDYVAEPNETDMDGEARVMFARVDMGADEFNPIHLGIVSKKRVSRTEFAYDCNATFTNLWPFAVNNVQLEMISAPDNMDINEPNVSFGDIEFRARDTITSIDTCTFQVDRSVTIEPDRIVWQVKCQMADTGMPIELTCAGALADDGKIGFEDLAELAGQWLKADGDGVVNFIDFARIAEKWQGQ